MNAADVTIVVPVKELEAAKSRLRPALRAGARRRLALDMYSHVLSVCLKASPAEVLILSPDATVGEIATSAGASWLRDPEPELNQSLARVFESCWRRRRTPVYVPSDLPLLEPSDLLSLVRARSGIVISPSRDRRGTNALLVPPETPMTPALGADSFVMHLSRADASGFEVAVCELAGVAFDVDTPADWAELRAVRAEKVASS